MKTTDTPTVHITVLTDDVVLVEAHPGVNIDAHDARRDNALIAELMPGDYGMIIDRKADYSIVPVEVYGVLNSMERLKAIAIVTHRTLTVMTAPAERPLYSGHFKLFPTIDSARAWLTTVLHG